MYLSKIKLNPRDPGVKQCLRNCEDLHRSLMRIFACSRKDAGVLFRLSSDRLQLYLLSKTAPKKEAMPSGMELIGVRDMSEFELRIQNGKVFSYNVIASPTKKVKTENNKNSQRRFLLSSDERRKWLDRQAKNNGFIIKSVQEKTQSSMFGAHSAEKGGSMHIPFIQFTGQLIVENAEQFNMAWENGCFLQVLFGQSCKTFLDIVACPNWTKLQSFG